MRQALYDAALLLDTVTEETAKAARARLAPELAKQGGDPSLTISAVGHAHIDLAWLWPLRETIRKGARTFATALRMMERYPDYVFGASQPQLFQWMKDFYPESLCPDQSPRRRRPLGVAGRDVGGAGRQCARRAKRWCGRFCTASGSSAPSSA